MKYLTVQTTIIMASLQCKFVEYIARCSQNTVRRAALEELNLPIFYLPHLYRVKVCSPYRCCNLFFHLLTPEFWVIFSAYSQLQVLGYPSLQPSPSMPAPAVPPAPQSASHSSDSVVPSHTILRRQAGQ